MVRSKGYRCRSYVQGDLLLFTSDDAYDALPEEVRFERERAAADAVTERFRVNVSSAPRLRGGSAGRHGWKGEVGRAANPP